MGMKRLFILIMAILLCFAMISCEKNEIKDPVDTAEPDLPVTENRIEVVVDTDSMKKEAVAALNSLNSTDLDDNGFTVASTADMVYVPENSESNYNVALRERNRMFGKKYSTELLQFRDNEDIILKTSYLNMLSGIYYTDLFSIPQKDLGKFITKGVLLKTTSVIGADFSKSWYDSSMMEQATYDAEAYAIYGAFNRDIANYYCLYVNRDLLASAGLAMPYDKVEAGSWTWDELIAMLRANAEINGTAGMASPSMQLLTKAVYKSSGASLIDTGYGKTPVAAYNNENGSAVLGLLRSVGGYKNLYNDTVEGSSAVAQFMSGNALFYIGTVGEMTTITTMTPDWCILPLPKLAASSENYYSYVSSDHAVIAVYAGSQCADMADALDGLYASSVGGYLADAYYYELIDNAIRDSEALDMMDYICGIKGGRPVNDLVDVYIGLDPYTSGALGKGMYNYDLTVDSIASSFKDGLSEAIADILLP